VSLLVTLHRRDLFRGVAGLAASSLSGLRAAGSRQFFLYYGTYTTTIPKYGTGESKGIYVSRFDTETGSLSEPILAAETKNPNYLATHPSQRYVYSVYDEDIDETGKAIGQICAYSVDRKTGKLTLLNRVSSKGGMPCNLRTDKTGTVLAVANWSTGSTVTLPVRSDGSLGEVATFYQHSGERSGVPPGGPPADLHCHSVSFSSDNRFLVATDTGLNKVFVHRLDMGKATFTPHQPPYLGLQHQANPRQLVFHPNGRWAYVTNESSPGCTMLRYDVAKGAFEEGATVRTVPESVTTRVSPAEIVMHPSGHFVFLSNRNHDSIAVMRIDPANGGLTLVEAFQPGGSGARSFNVDPTGKFLIALMQRTKEIIPLRIDLESGKLSPAGPKLTLPAPVCAKFIELS